MSFAGNILHFKAATGSALQMAFFATVVVFLFGDCHRDLRMPEHTPRLHQAVAENAISALKELSNSDLNQVGPHGFTPLHYAAIYNAPEAGLWLIEKGARLNPTDFTGMTPLHWASRKGHEKMVQLLLDKGAEVMARNKFDMTPLHEARTVRVAELLLKAGAELMARDIDGMTPLHTISTEKVAQFLIKRGADVNARAKDGLTPMNMPPIPRPRVEGRASIPPPVSSRP